MLLDCGAFAHEFKTDSPDALSVAIRLHSETMVKALLKAHPGAFITGSSKPSRLSEAARYSTPSMCQLLLDFAKSKGINPGIESVDADGWRPLHLAVRGAQTEIVRLLLTAGANLEAADDDPHSECNSLDRDRVTPLMCATVQGLTEIVTLLLSDSAEDGLRSKPLKNLDIVLVIKIK